MTAKASEDAAATAIESRFSSPGELSPFERVRCALAREPVDRVPLEAGHFYSTEFLGSWAAAKGREKASKRDIDDYYGSDVAEIAADHTPWPTRAKTIEDTDEHIIELDGFGQTKKHIKGKPFWQAVSCAIGDKSQLDGFEFDPADIDSRYDGLVRGASELAGRRWTRIKVGGPYSRSKWMRGEEQFLIDMIEDPPFVKALIGRIADLLIAVGLESIRRAGLAETGIHIHDDMASLNSMFFSPAAFEEFLLEPYTRMCEAFHGAGVRVFYGGEGNIAEVFEMLLAAGIDGFICMELRAGMDMVELRRDHGPETIFFGNMCNTVTLPSGDRELIRAEVSQQLAVAREGGCVVGPSHLIGPDITVESYEWMIQAIREMGQRS